MHFAVILINLSNNFPLFVSPLKICFLPICGIPSCHTRTFISTLTEGNALQFPGQPLGPTLWSLFVWKKLYGRICDLLQRFSKHIVAYISSWREKYYLVCHSALLWMHEISQCFWHFDIFFPEYEKSIWCVFKDAGRHCYRMENLAVLSHHFSMNFEVEHYHSQ